jgi:hypothetical protein
MNSIVYKSHYDKTEITLPIGRIQSVQREGACLDICLTRDVAHDCPLAVTILIRTTGEIVLWNTDWRSTRAANTYWHFGAEAERDATIRRPTTGQLATLERMFLCLTPVPGGLDSTLGGPVASWAFKDQTPEGIAAKHHAPTPAMNRGD